MSVPSSVTETRVAVLVDCDNTSPAILAYALRMVAQFGRVVLRRGYGNHTTLSAKWQAALVEQAAAAAAAMHDQAGELETLVSQFKLDPQQTGRRQLALV